MRSPLPILLAMSACASAPPPPPPPPPRAVAPPPPAARGDAPRERRYTLESDRLPPEFAYLPPRDREQWHACRAFFLRRRPTACGPDDDPRACGPGRPSIHLEFTVHVADYLGEPDAAARRALLIAHGCPDTLVDLADGTHLDLVEGPKEPDAGAAP